MVFMKEINNFSCICGADWAKLNYTRPVGELLALKDNINLELDQPKRSKPEVTNSWYDLIETRLIV